MSIWDVDLGYLQDEQDDGPNMVWYHRDGSSSEVVLLLMRAWSFYNMGVLRTMIISSTVLANEEGTCNQCNRSVTFSRRKPSA